MRLSWESWTLKLASDVLAEMQPPLSVFVLSGAARLSILNVDSLPTLTSQPQSQSASLRDAESFHLQFQLELLLAGLKMSVNESAAPTPSPSKRSSTVITAVQKQALIDNLQLEGKQCSHFPSDAV
jgi:hypothetical protein